ncbi:MAG: DMT family transporter [Bacteroidia bacterium]|jgi:drug/metabolite transporter (DMT)-like permease|nr:DMT family transporter [Bacteroidia bacterium]
MNINKDALTHLKAVMAMVFWGMSYLWSKKVFEFIDPASTVFFRLIISTIFLFLLLVVRKQIPRLNKEQIKLLAVAALFNPFLYFLSENYGLKHVSPTLSSVIIAMIPVFMPLVAFFTLRERVSLINIIGLFVSFSGVLIMVVDRSFNLSASPLGLALLFMAVGSALVHGIILRKLTFSMEPLAIIAIENSIGVIYLIPFLFFTGGAQAFVLPLNGELLINLLALGIFASSAAYVFYAATVKQFGITRANFYANLIPVFTAFFSWLLLGEIIGLDKLAGITLVISGVVLAQKRSKISIKQ